jgi:hypothetical protein
MNRHSLQDQIFLGTSPNSQDYQVTIMVPHHLGGFQGEAPVPEGISEAMGTRKGSWRNKPIKPNMKNDRLPGFITDWTG